MPTSCATALGWCVSVVSSGRLVRTALSLFSSNCSVSERLRRRYRPTIARMPPTMNGIRQPNARSCSSLSVADMATPMSEASSSAEPVEV